MNWLTDFVQFDDRVRGVLLLLLGCLALVAIPAIYLWEFIARRARRGSRPTAPKAPPGPPARP